MMKSRLVLRSVLAISLATALVPTLLVGCSSTDKATPDAPTDQSSATQTPSEESTSTAPAGESGGYPIVDTGQVDCYDVSGYKVEPAENDPLLGSDAKHAGNQPSYTDNKDGTVTDNVTGLMWTRSPDINGDGTIDSRDKRSYKQALASTNGFAFAGFSDWRLPTIKELYSLIDFRGIDPSGLATSDTSGLTPFIDTDYFEFGYGDTAAGERIIDAQYASSTKYVTTTMGGEDTMFGVNFADGRIKGYPTGPAPGQSEDKGYYVLYVRGNEAYGRNAFVDNGDGTITDEATGLMWSQDDSRVGMNWLDALTWAQTMNAKEYLGYSDWRLPNIKELQSIVDYTRAPAVTNSAAIDPLFNVTQIVNEADAPDAPFYWSSTTHAAVARTPGADAAYIAFGRAMGFMNGRWIDVHGAGAQRSDPKTGDSANWPEGHGPQGDAIHIDNYVRLVRDVDE